MVLVLLWKTLNACNAAIHMPCTVGSNSLTNTELYLSLVKNDFHEVARLY